MAPGQWPSRCAAAPRTRVTDHRTHWPQRPESHTAAHHWRSEFCHPTPTFLMGAHNASKPHH
eukprot:4263209-Amphidinium_carterae.1